MLIINDDEILTAARFSAVHKKLTVVSLDKPHKPLPPMERGAHTRQLSVHF
jgi:hypothetical protein